MPFGAIADSNILLDIFTNDPHWGDWSAKQLALAFDIGPVIINPLIYAEISVGFSSIEELEFSLPVQIGREDLPWEAAFLAGKCFKKYRQHGGLKTAPLPDFYIASHAVVTGRVLITRDRRTYQKIFPDLEVIAP